MVGNGRLKERSLGKRGARPCPAPAHCHWRETKKEKISLRFILLLGDERLIATTVGWTRLTYANKRLLEANKRLMQDDRKANGGQQRLTKASTSLPLRSQIACPIKQRSNEDKDV